MIYNRWKCCWAWWHVWYTSARPQVIAHRCCVTRDEGVANHRLSLFLSLNWIHTQNSSISSAMLFACWIVRPPFITCCLSIEGKPTQSGTSWPYWRTYCAPEPRTSASSRIFWLKEVISHYDTLKKVSRFNQSLNRFFLFLWLDCRHEFGASAIQSKPPD